jgi:hypothetical protein
MFALLAHRAKQPSWCAAAAKAGSFTAKTTFFGVIIIVSPSLQMLEFTVAKADELRRTSSRRSKLFSMRFVRTPQLQVRRGPASLNETEAHGSSRRLEILGAIVLLW